MTSLTYCCFRSVHSSTSMNEYLTWRVHTVAHLMRHCKRQRGKIPLSNVVNYEQHIPTKWQNVEFFILRKIVTHWATTWWFLGLGIVMILCFLIYISDILYHTQLWQIIIYKTYHTFNYRCNLAQPESIRVKIDYRESCANTEARQIKIVPRFKLKSQNKRVYPLQAVQNPCSNSFDHKPTFSE